MSCAPEQRRKQLTRCWANESASKPDSVLPAMQRREVVNIHLDRPLLAASSSVPADWASSLCPRRHTTAGTPSCPRWGLPSRASRLTRWCAFTAPFHPYLLAQAGGGLFSVALSRRSPWVAVSNHRALWSPDFPRRHVKRIVTYMINADTCAASTRLAHSHGITLQVRGVVDQPNYCGSVGIELRNGDRREIQV